MKPIHTTSIYRPGRNLTPAKIFTHGWRELLTIGVSLTVLVVFSLSNTVSALDPAQKALHDAHIRHFNIKVEEACALSGGGDGDPTLVGSEDAEKTYNFLVGKGLKPFQAAGVMGNMHVESGIQPQRLQNTRSGVRTPAESVGNRNTGWGIVQWTPASKFISTQNPISKANELGVQLQFLWDQLEGRPPLSEKRAGDDLKATTSLEQAVLAFQGNRSVGGQYTGYERPKDQAGSVPERTSAARDYLAKYGSNAPASMESYAGAPITGCATAGGDASGSGTVIGDLALPLDQKWYDEHPTWFTKKHHSPPPAADIPAPQGTPVYSMTGGTVLRAPINNGYGLGVEIDAGNGVVIKYAHGTDGGQVPGAKKGDIVKPGQRIMTVGNTGKSTGPHLHLEISLGGANGQDVCPQPLLQALYEKKPAPTFSALPRTGCY